MASNMRPIILLLSLGAAAGFAPSSLLAAGRAPGVVCARAPAPARGSRGGAGALTMKVWEKRETLAEKLGGADDKVRPPVRLARPPSLGASEKVHGSH